MTSLYLYIYHFFINFRNRPNNLFESLFIVEEVRFKMKFIRIVEVVSVLMQVIEWNVG